MKKLVLIICVIIFITGCTKCPNDSNKIDGKCFVFHYKIPEEKPTCEANYELIDNKCVKVEKRKAEYKSGCPNGYIFQNNSCIRVESVQFNLVYSCSGYYSILIEDRCYSISNIEFRSYYYMCGSGATLEGSNCNFVRNFNTNVNIYRCSTKNNNYKCTNGSTSWISNYYYGCDNSGLGGTEIEHLNVCYNRNLSVPASATKVCPDGFIKNSGGTNCTRNLSTDVKVTYSCNSGEKLEGSDCVVRTEMDTTLSLVCDENYDLIEQQCVLSEEVSPIKN